MTVEINIFDALKGLVSNRVFPDVAPALVAKPYIVYQQVGGESVNFLERSLPNKNNGRFQVACWGDNRVDVAALARQVEAALRLTTTLQVMVLGAPVAVYEEDTKLFGTRQDFSIWF